MYANITFTSAGEMFPATGLVNYLSNNTINFANYDKMDELRIAAVKFKLQSMLDKINPSEIVFDEFPTEQRNIISQLYYGNKIIGVVNTIPATAKKRFDSDMVRFEDPSEGYIAVLHAMLRKSLIEATPIEMVLGQIHSIATKFLYTTIIRSFDRYFNLMDKKEYDLAKIRYACAYVSAAKMFKLTTEINDVAVPVTRMTFGRVDPREYVTGDDLSTYAGVANYLNTTGVMSGMNSGQLIEAFIRQLGYRSLVILECGADFFIDALLSRSVGRIIPRNLFKLIGQRECEILAKGLSAILSGSNVNAMPKLYSYRAPVDLTKPQ